MSDLNDKYERLKAAGMPEIADDEDFVLIWEPKTRSGQWEWQWRRGDDEYNDPIMDQHAEDLITMAATRWFLNEHPWNYYPGECSRLLFDDRQFPREYPGQDYYRGHEYRNVVPLKKSRWTALQWYKPHKPRDEAHVHAEGVADTIIDAILDAVEAK